MSDNKKELREFEEWLDDIYYELRDDVSKLIVEAGEVALRSAKDNAPVDTGYMRRNIRMEVEQSGDNITSTVYSNAEYSL